MIDPRNDRLADLLVKYSCAVKKGDLVYLAIKGTDAIELGKTLIRKVTEAGGVPFWQYNDDALIRQFLMYNNEAQIKAYAKFMARLMKNTDCFISIAGSNNAFDLADIPAKKMAMFKKYYAQPVMFKYIINRARWVAMRFPNNSMAQLAEQPQEVFEKFYYDVCCLDYKKMSQAMKPLKALMERTDKVHITAKGTDLTFSIKGMTAIPCDGHQNIPDGEVFTAPVRDSINGVITYNTPSLYEGVVFNDIRFEFKNGKIIKATCSGNTGKLNRILDTDPGARYVGEFALGVNPLIKEPMKDTLFDEKIDGSFHLTPGRCYDEAPNGNKSAIHWDLVLIQRKDYGGGEIWFNDKLIRKDGNFVVPQLKGKFTKKALGG